MKWKNDLSPVNRVLTCALVAACFCVVESVVFAQSETKSSLPPISGDPCGGFAIGGDGGSGGGGDPTVSSCGIPVALDSALAMPLASGGNNLGTNGNPSGCVCPSGTEGCPVAVVSGAVVLNETDIVVPAPLLDLVFMRHYDSDLGEDNGLGYRWEHSYSWKIVKYRDLTVASGELGSNLGDGIVLRALADPWQGPYKGAHHWFAKQSDGSYSVSHTAPYVLSIDGSNEYDVKIPGGIVYHFDSDGVLESINHPAGQSVTLTYDANDRLDKVEHSNGQYLDFSYYTNAGMTELIKDVTTVSTNLSASFSYVDKDKMVLSKVTRHTPRGDFDLNYTYREGNPSLPQESVSLSAGGASIPVAGFDATSGLSAMPSPKPDARMLSHSFADGYVASYSYRDIDDSGGARASHTIVSNYLHEVSLDYSPGTTVAHRVRGDIDQEVTYLYNEHMDITAIIGPNTTNYDTRIYWDSHRDVTNHLVNDFGTDEYLRTKASYGYFHNPTNVGFGFSQAPQNIWNAEWEDASLQLKKVTSPEDRVFNILYTNGLPSRTWVSASGGNLLDTLFGYTTNGLLSVVTNANGNTVQLEYNSAGYVTNITPEVGPQVGFLRDALGYATNIIMPGASGPRVTSLQVDDRGRPQHISYPNGQEMSLTYDGRGRVTEYVDTAGRTGKYDYVFGSLVSSERVLTGASNQTAKITVDIDNFEHAINIKDELGRSVESYVLDDADRVVTVTNLEGQSMSVDYAVAGVVESINRFDGSDVDLTYDGEARVTQVAYDSVTNSYSYDNDGLLTEGSSEAGSISNAYNEAGWLTSIGHQISGLSLQPSLTYLYTPAGQVSNTVSLVGTNVYIYDAAERLSDISSRMLPGTLDFSLSYNQYNGLVELATNVESGLKVEYEYDVVDRVTNIVWKDASDTVVRGFAYSYDDASMITQKVVTTSSSTNTEVYAYDSLDRLISETFLSASATSVVSYAYDLTGNRTTVTSEGTDEDYTLGQGNRLAAWGTNDENSVSYDAAGCVTNLEYGGGLSLDLTWNDRYQLTSFSTNGSDVESYAYDLLGNRVKTVTATDSGSETNYHLYDGAQCIADMDATGGVIRSYVWGTGIDNLLAMSVHTGATVKTYYAITDHLGSIHALVDDTGTVVESYKFDAWGRVLGVYDSNNQQLNNSAIGNRYLWQGREYSFETGFYYFRARWYDPITGRWLSKDPIGISGGLNQYVFCGSNPVNFVDPMGLVTQHESGFWGKVKEVIDVFEIEFSAGLQGSMKLGTGSVGVDFGTERTALVGATWVDSTTKGFDITIGIKDLLGASIGYSAERCGHAENQEYDVFGRRIRGESIQEYMRYVGGDPYMGFKAGPLGGKVGEDVKMPFGGAFILGAEVRINFSEIVDVYQSFYR